MTNRERHIRRLKEILQDAVDNIEVRSDTDVYSRALKLLVEYALEHALEEIEIEKNTTTGGSENHHIVKFGIGKIYERPHIVDPGVEPLCSKENPNCNIFGTIKPDETDQGQSEKSKN